MPERKYQSLAEGPSRIPITKKVLIQSIEVPNYLFRIVNTMMVKQIVDVFDHGAHRRPTGLRQTAVFFNFARIFPTASGQLDIPDPGLL